MSADESARLIAAAERADWMQVVLNQGPPCFHLEPDGRFCLRVERWAGHGRPDDVMHQFVSLADLLTAVLRSSGAEPPTTDRSELIEKAREITATYAPGEHGLTNRLVQEFENLFAVSYLQGQIRAGSSPSPAKEGPANGSVDNDSVRGAAGVRDSDVGNTQTIQAAQAPSPAPERPAQPWEVDEELRYLIIRGRLLTSGVCDEWEEAPRRMPEYDPRRCIRCARIEGEHILRRLLKRLPNFELNPAVPLPSPPVIGR